MPTVELPDAWALVAPCGCTDGLTLAVSNGKIRHATAEDAWKMFSPLKKDRDKEAKQGYRVEPRNGDRLMTTDCPHEPKWGIPA